MNCKKKVDFHCFTFNGVSSGEKYVGLSISDNSPQARCNIVFSSSIWDRIALNPNSMRPRHTCLIYILLRRYDWRMATHLIFYEMIILIIRNDFPSHIQSVVKSIHRMWGIAGLLFACKARLRSNAYVCNAFLFFPSQIDIHKVAVCGSFHSIFDTGHKNKMRPRTRDQTK